MDIILPRKRDKWNNRIGFVKVQSEKEALRAIELMKDIKLGGVKMDIMLARKFQKKGVESPKREGAKPGDRPPESKTIRVPKETSVKMSSEDNHRLESLKQRKESGRTEEGSPVPKRISVQENSLINTENCLVGFSAFPLRGEILQEVLIELGMAYIEVKEISCWKFLLRFASEEKLKDWNGDGIKDWICLTRNLSEEDLIPKRRALIEIRGLPLHYWSEENLEKITQEYGLWGWWRNRPDAQMKIETPLIWIYSGCLEKIEENLVVITEGGNYRVKILEVEDNQGPVFEEAKQKFVSNRMVEKPG